VREGFPNVVLEAAASGVPSVVLEATGSVDAVQPGRTGFVVKNPRPEEFSQALRSALADSQAMGASARGLAETSYSSREVWALIEAFTRGTDERNAGVEGA
jgi:glycosyltransferase involved in cell wall biosynthesis